MTTRFGTGVATIALDAGGTEIKGAFRDAAGETIALRRWPMPRVEGPGASVAAVLDAVAELAGEFTGAQAVGLVIPGTVDAGAGVAIYSENIGWTDVPFRNLLSNATGLPVGFGHDVRAGGLAERTYGAAADVRDVLFMPMGTGISGAMIVEDRLVDGMYTGEIGHLDVGSGRNCVCGLVGCLETLATGPSIARLYEERTGEAVDGAKPVVERMAAGDSVAAEVWNIAIGGTAIALASYCTLLAPELVLIGGGLSGAGELLLAPLQQQLDSKLLWQRRPRLEIASLGDLAGNVGAHLLAKQAFDDARDEGTTP